MQSTSEQSSQGFQVYLKSLGSAFSMSNSCSIWGRRSLRYSTKDRLSLLTTLGKNLDRSFSSQGSLGISYRQTGLPKRVEWRWTLSLRSIRFEFRAIFDSHVTWFWRDRLESDRWELANASTSWILTGWVAGIFLTIRRAFHRRSASDSGVFLDFDGRIGHFLDALPSGTVVHGS